MGGIVFDPKISWGHITQILALVIGLAAGYAQLKADDRDLAQQIMQSNERFSKMAELIEVRAGARIDANSARIESQSRLISAQLDTIADSLQELRASVKEIRDNGG